MRMLVRHLVLIYYSKPIQENPLDLRTQDQRFATTLAHGLDLLHCFTPFEPSLSNGELARKSGLSKATVSRLSYTLEIIGLLRFDQEARRYRLGAASLSIGHPLMAQLTVRQTARPLMQSLADQTGGTVSVGLRHRASIIYVETTRAHDAGDFRPDIGASLPLLDTAVGRAWLAACEDDERSNGLEWLARERKVTVRAAREIIQTAKDDLANKGYCVSLGNFRPDVNAVAVPLAVRFRGELVMLNCGVLSSRMSASQVSRSVGPLLKKTALAVERLQRQSEA